MKYSKKYKNIELLLPDYVQGLLDEKEAAYVEKAVSESAYLKKECKELRAYYKAIKLLKPHTAPDDMLEKIYKRLEEETPLKRFLNALFRPSIKKTPLLAGAALAAIAVVVIYNPFTSKRMTPTVIDKTSAPLTPLLKKEKATGQEKSGIEIDTIAKPDSADSIVNPEGQKINGVNDQ